MYVEYGDIFMAQLGNPRGSIQGGRRPVIICSNHFNNKYARILTVIPLTSKQTKKRLPVHVELPSDFGELPKASIALVEQLTVINKSQICSLKIGSIKNTIYEAQIKKAIEVQLEL